MKRASLQKIELTQVTLAQSLRIWIAYNQLVAQFKKRYPNEAILVASQTLQSKPQAVFSLLKSKLGVDLQYVPFSSVLDEKIWHQKPEPELKMRALATLFNASGVENTLARLSDL